MKRILILTHKQDRFCKINYMLREIAAFWKTSGAQVDIQQGPMPSRDYDIAILHVDLTKVGLDYLDAAKRFPVVINGYVIDISKKTISKNIVRKGDGYEGSVIVKTDLNCGGAMEAIHIRANGGVPKAVFKIRQLLPWRFRKQLAEYPIFPRVADVPVAVWRNRSLVVERFQAERQGELYCLRSWVFLGDRESNSISYSYSPVIKSHNVIRRESVPEVPMELRQMRAQLAFDFGKFDYALIEGRVVLYDVNKTPTLGVAHEHVVQNMGILAEGIEFYGPWR